jgi:hypothetical protein
MPHNLRKYLSAFERKNCKLTTGFLIYMKMVKSKAKCYEEQGKVLVWNEEGSLLGA